MLALSLKTHLITMMATKLLMVGSIYSAEMLEGRIGWWTQQRIHPTPWGALKLG